MARRTHTLSVKGEDFTNQFGETKFKWIPIGSVIEGPHGSFLLLDRHINLAGFKGEGPVKVSMFPCQPKDETPPSSSDLQYGRHHDLDDNIPF